MYTASLMSLGRIFMLINSGVLPTISPTINKVNSTKIIIVIIPVPTAPGIACTNMARKNEIVASGDIPAKAEFAAPVFVPKETVSNKILPKLPNRVSK